MSGHYTISYLYQTYNPMHCSIPIYQYTNLPIYQYTNTPTYQSSNIPIHCDVLQCENNTATNPLCICIGKLWNYLPLVFKSFETIGLGIKKLWNYWPLVSKCLKLLAFVFNHLFSFSLPLSPYWPLGTQLSGRLVMVDLKLIVGFEKNWVWLANAWGWGGMWLRGVWLQGGVSALPLSARKLILRIFLFFLTNERRK